MGCGGSKQSPPGSKAGNGAPRSKEQEKKKAAAAPAKKPTGKIQMTADGKERIVMEKFRMGMAKDAEMGQGTSSICRRGRDHETGAAVAIKVYKDDKKGNVEDVMMKKFKRQVEVLTELQEPFIEPKDQNLWHEALAAAKPSSLFMTLLDYSKDTSGPAADPSDGVVYVITELAQYSLKDYLALRREQCKAIPKESVKSIARAIVLVVAGLHAKGLVHIDLKPENLMMFGGRLKLIDVDGCVKIGTQVSIQDSSISFSPCYCAPEWAKFLINESNSKISVEPCLDVWSVGMTICELVTLTALLKTMYGNFLRNAHSHREAGFLFMDWLTNIKKVPLTKVIEKYDPEFVDFIQNWVVVCDKTKRKTCAQCLSHPYIMSAAKPDSKADGAVSGEDMPKDVGRSIRARPVDDSNAAPLYKGTLWKLMDGADPKEPKNWLKRDMWLAQQGSLCYFSSEENKRLVLIEGSKLAQAEIKPFEGCILLDGAKPALTVTYDGETEDTKESIVLAVNSTEEYETWQDKLKSACRMDLPTMQLGGHVAELRKFVISVKNRRQKVEDEAKEQFAPIFKEKLWKLKAVGNKLDPEQWFEREMWISKNGSLVYYSKKEEQDLVYYTSADLMRATYSNVPASETCKPYTFLVHLAEADGVSFAPGEFAANTDELRTRWIEEFTSLGKKG